MEPNDTRRNNSALKEVANCFENIGWEKRLCDLQEREVLGLIAIIQKARDLTDDYTEQGVLEFEQSVTRVDEPFFDDPIPF
tara:strand:- start:1433 stop:1675 length:243 start_codon:yes stop_codon:yes gene_type:complete